MADEISMAVPVRPHEVEIVLMPEVPTPPPAGAVTSLTPEQVQAREVVFQQDAQDRESRQVAGIVGLWTGTLLLHDLAIEHLSPAENEDSRPRRPKLDEDDDER